MRRGSDEVTGRRKQKEIERGEEKEKTRGKRGYKEK